MKDITIHQFLNNLRQACHEAGSQAKWAKEHEISAAYVSDVLNGNRAPSYLILDALGFEEITLYRKRNK